MAERPGYGRDLMLRSLDEVQLTPIRVIIELSADEFAMLEQRIERLSLGPSVFAKACVLRELKRGAGGVSLMR